MFKLISSLIIPLLVLVVIIYALVKKINVYDTFIEGSKDCFELMLDIFPTMLAMILGINIFIKSGIIEFCLNNIEHYLKLIKVPLEVIPMIIMRPISGSSTLAILNSIFQKYGTDEYIGILASIIQGSTDTTFYVLTLYFGSIGIKKIRYAMWAGLGADLIGITASILIANILF